MSESSILAWSVVDALSRNWAIVAIASTIVTLCLVPALVIARYVRIAMNILRSTRPPLARSPLDYARLEGEPLSFPAYDGLRLAGMLVRASPSRPRRGAVIFAHEYCSDMHSCARYCRPLREAGYDVFTFDFRGHGQSESEPGYTPRQWVTDRELHDMRGAVAYLDAWLERSGLPREIGLFGISRGACAAILVAAECPNVRAIVADGAFSTDRTIEWLMRRWAYIFARVRVVYENHPPDFWRFLRWAMLSCARREFGCTFPSVVKAIQRMKPRPILFIHGEKDSYLPVAQSRLLYALAGQPKYLWVAPGARHNQAAVVHPQLYARITVDFFDRHLAARPPAPGPVRTSPAEPVFDVGKTVVGEPV